jgi:hypothetical protein
MKRLLFLMTILSCFVWNAAYADCSFTFTNDGYGVTGTVITSSNGDGTFTVTGGSVSGIGTGNDGVLYSLVPISAATNPGPPPSIRPFAGLPGDGTDLIFDNQLMPGSETVLIGNGLLFEAGSGSSAFYINIWGNSPSSYTLWGLSYNTTLQRESYGIPNVDGEVTITPKATTPIPGAVWLLGSGLMGLVGIRRRQRNWISSAEQTEAPGILFHSF